MKNLTINGGGEDAALGEILPATLDRRAGRTYLANASTVTPATLSTPLTSYAVSYMDTSDLAAAIRFIAPDVRVPDRGGLFEFTTYDNNEFFIAEAEADVVRGMGADFKRVEYTGDKSQSKLLEKGLTYRLDRNDDQFGPRGSDQARRKIVAMLSRRLLRIDLRAVIALLDASGDNTNLTWDPTVATTNPKAQLRTAVRERRLNRGMRPNSMLMGDLAEAYWQAFYEAQDTAGAFAFANMTAADIARSLGLSNGRMMDEVYQSAAAAKSDILGAKVFFFYAQAVESEEDPSNIKRFFQPTQSGAAVTVYIDDSHANYDDITVYHQNRFVVVDANGIEERTISNS